MKILCNIKSTEVNIFKVILVTFLKTLLSTKIFWFIPTFLWKYAILPPEILKVNHFKDVTGGSMWQLAKVHYMTQ